MCIDLKSFYASCECVERGLNPMTTNLVVADYSRTNKTICLAVSPSLKSYGIPGRARLYEVFNKVSKVNNERRKCGKLTGKSHDFNELCDNPRLEVDFIIAPPRMKLYMDYSKFIYSIYLKYLSADDIHVYSVDEVFCDITPYLSYYKMGVKEFVTMVVLDIYESTGIVSTAGVGTNLYLAKVAMDILGKHVDADSNGVRVAFLNERLYRKFLWDYKPLTDFWRIGKGYSKKLESIGYHTMGDIARGSIRNEDVFYRLFGVNAELLIDHAWGWEPCTISDIKSYKPLHNSLSTSQVLPEAYDFIRAKLIVKEMVDLLSLDMVSKGYVSDTFVLSVGYDISNVTSDYNGEVSLDHYGRCVPKPVRGTVRLSYKSSSSDVIMDKIIDLFEKIVSSDLLVRRINISVVNLCDFSSIENDKVYKQFDIFSNPDDEDLKFRRERSFLKKEMGLQKVIVGLKSKYGKNSILKGMNLSDGATTVIRNNQIGGHRA